jgi:hypothetical protein
VVDAKFEKVEEGRCRAMRGIREIALAQELNRRTREISSNYKENKHIWVHLT